MYFNISFVKKIILSLLLLDIGCFGNKIINSETSNIFSRTDDSSETFSSDNSSSTILLLTSVDVNQTSKSTDLPSTSDSTVNSTSSTLSPRIYNRICNWDNECNGLDNGKCINSRCKCRYGYGNFDNSDTCQDFRYYECLSNSECQDADENRYCDFEASSHDLRKCKCKYGYIEDNFSKKCVKKDAGLGEPCKVNHDCKTKHTLCNYYRSMYICTCEPRYEPVFRFCERKYCYGDYNCMSFNYSSDSNLKCSNNLCDCGYGYKMDLTSGRCVYDYVKTTSDPDVRPINEDDNNNHTKYLYFLLLLLLLPVVIIAIFIRKKCKETPHNQQPRNLQRHDLQPHNPQRNDLPLHNLQPNWNNTVVPSVIQTSGPSAPDYAEFYRVCETTSPEPLPAYEQLVPSAPIDHSNGHNL